VAVELAELLQARDGAARSQALRYFVEVGAKESKIVHLNLC
jgi:hypothetical protein